MWCFSAFKIKLSKLKLSKFKVSFTLESKIKSYKEMVDFSCCFYLILNERERKKRKKGDTLLQKIPQKELPVSITAVIFHCFHWDLGQEAKSTERCL